MPHHDLIIIGTGSGNSVITPELEGLDIAIVEDGRFGGTCLNVGCIPTKMFVLPADRVREAQDSSRLGVDFEPPQVHWDQVRDRIFGRIDPIAAGGEDYRRSQDFVTVYRATAAFSDLRELTLSTGEVLTADRIVVAAGSHPNPHPVPSLAIDPTRGVHTSDSIMRLAELPERMTIIGGGFVACEFAHVFSSLGVEVTQVHRGATLLAKEDAPVAHAYTRAAAEYVDLRLHAEVVAAERIETEWKLTLTEAGESVDVVADVILLALGRTPNGERLNVAAGGIGVDDDGFVVVDDEQRTTADGVWALGDVSSPWQLKHVANHEAKVVAHNVARDLGRIAGPPARSNHRFVPHAVFGHPQIAAFGPTAAQLDRAGRPYVSKTQRFGDVAYGWALEDESGFLTLYADPSDHTLLAAHCIGPMSSTVIQPLIQAAAFGQRVEDVARGQYWIHPALSEVVENALLGLDFQAPDNTA